MATIELQGGAQLRRFVREAKRMEFPEGEIGVYRTARYRTGQYVAEVFAWNEFGTKRIPSRPAFRRTLFNLQRDSRFKRLLVQSIELPHGVTQRGMGRAMTHAAGRLQKQIIDLRRPPNAPTTIKRKGSTNPLVDTGLLTRSVTWRVRRRGGSAQ